jgi:hypothetical protein
LTVVIESTPPLTGLAQAFDVTLPAVTRSSLDTTTCAPSCLAGGLGSVRPLLAAKSLPHPTLDAAFTWPADPAGPPWYHLNALATKSDITEIRAKRDPVGVGQPICTTAAPQCTHVDALIAPEALLFYQAFSACGDRGDEEGPF